MICISFAACSMDTTSIEDRIGRQEYRPQPETAATGPSSATTQSVATHAMTIPTATTRPTPKTTLWRSPGSFTVSVDEAIFVSLENNRALAVERLNPQIRRTTEQRALSEFDPVLTAGTSYDRKHTVDPPLPVSEGGSVNAGIREFLPTGTTLEFSSMTDILQGDRGMPDDWTSRIEMSATQSLLRGGGIAVNMVNVRQARIDTLSSQYELRGFAQDLVAEVEQTYWDCVLAQRRIEIVQNALNVAQQQYEETRERINVGKLAETEVAAAEAEVALRREQLINANSLLETTRLKLWRLVNPFQVKPADAEINLVTLPSIPEIKLDDVELHIDLAMRMRPDLNQARLLIQRNDLELVRTRNGLLPRLDLFMTLGGTGYAESFGRSVRQEADHNYDFLIGVSGEFAPINRDARAQHKRASLNREQAVLALENLAQLAEVDVRGAYIELKRSQEQVRATEATRRLQEVTLRSETEKFRIGKSTSILVAQAQRDLLSAQLSEVNSVVTFLKSVVELRRMEGSLLEYHGVACPGREPVLTDALPVKRGV